ncbi:hypothetical protein QQ045_020450 [Rhodiola kirilowii]
MEISSQVVVSKVVKRQPQKSGLALLRLKGGSEWMLLRSFLQDLYKSRSRHIMVMHVILKEQEGKDSEALAQIVDSYVADDRGRVCLAAAWIRSVSVSRSPDDTGKDSVAYAQGSHRGSYFRW